MEQVTNQCHSWSLFNFHSFFAEDYVPESGAVSLSEWVPMAGRMFVLSLLRISSRRSFEVLETGFTKTQRYIPKTCVFECYIYLVTNKSSLSPFNYQSAIRYVQTASMAKFIKLEVFVIVLTNLLGSHMIAMDEAICFVCAVLIAVC